MKKLINWKKSSRYKEPKESVGFLVWQVSVNWKREVEESLKAVGVTHAQFSLLATLGWLMERSDEVTQVELSRYCNSDVNTVSQVIKSMEKKGFIKRLQKKNNARSKFPVLTAAGIDLVEQAIPLVENVDETYFRKLSVADKKILTGLLKKFI